MRFRPFLALMIPPTVIAVVVATAIAATPPGPDRSGPVASTSANPSAAAAPTGSGQLSPKAVDKEVVEVVGRMLRDIQYEAEPIDDARSEVWFDEYLHRLDPQRMIFRKADVDGFRQFRDSLDDALFASPLPKLDLAMTMFDTYRKRYREYAEASAAFAAGPVDLTNPEQMAIDRWDGDAPWPASEAEAKELWRQRVESDLIDGLLPGKDPEDQVKQRLHDRYLRFARRQDQMKVGDVLEVYLGALTQSFDPHSVWLKPADNANFNIDITNSVVGIGAQLSTEEDFVVVNELIRGGPAQKSGLVRKKDRILAVGQADGAIEDVVGQRLDDVVQLIRGKKGTDVRLLLQHEDGVREEIRLTREQVALEDQRASSRLDTVSGHRIGVLSLPGFYLDPNHDPDGHNASDDLRREIDALKTQGAEALILDLRGNGGGSLAEAVDTAGLFLPGGPMVQVRDRDGHIEALRDLDKAVEWSGPLVVMTDATSASASEIVAGALQDYGRAIVVGDAQTHGKGTVQQVLDLDRQLRGNHDPDAGGAFKVSIQKFYRVSGASTQLKGVAADVVLPSAWEGWDVFERDLDHAMDWDRIPPAPFVRWADPSAAVPELQKRSATRVASEPEFQKQARISAERIRRKDATSVSLQLSERKAELDAWKALVGDEEDDEKDLTEEQKRERARAKDYALDEGEAVVVDLLSLGGAPAPR